LVVSSKYIPTAWQKVVLTHEMACSSLVSVPWLGLETIDQLVPSQDSTRVSSWGLGVDMNALPTARHDEDEVHVTPASESDTLGLGLLATDHEVPSHDSMRV
jgi:hypothetical protein